MTRVFFIFALFAAILIGCTEAWAQETDAAGDTTQVEEEQPAPVAEPAPTPQPARDPRVFGKGSIRASFILGFGTAYDNSYLLLGVGGGYYLANGLEVGLELLSWLGQNPTMLQITPEIRYVVWQTKRLHPYGGLFYRHSMISGRPDQDSVGSRFGIMYRRGGSYVGIGGVYNHLLDCDDTAFNCDTVYPEVFFALYW